jgi:hypothetical protein
MACGRCGKPLSPVWRGKCNHCGAAYSDFPPVERAAGTEALIPTASAAVAPALPASANIPWNAVMIVAGGAFAMLGSFLPWITATAAFVGTISRNGIDGGGDGLITIILGLAAAACGVDVYRRRTRVASIGALACGLGLVGIVALDIGSINDRIADINTESAFASVGMGIYVVALGGVLAILGGVAAVSESRRLAKTVAVPNR